MLFKILVVDDDPVTLKLASKYLRDEGYAVETASNGESGWALALKGKPDLIISDWSMPDISGIVLCQRIKANLEYPQLKNIYFILLTAYSDLKHRVYALDAGADECLTKPIDPSELRARVRAGLRLCLLAKSRTEVNRKLMVQNELLSLLDLTDRLTGALNRQAMDKALPRLLEKVRLGDKINGHDCLSILIIGVNDFQQIKDSYGHLIADEVLKAAFERLQDSVTSDTLLYRYDTEKFACITTDLGLVGSLELGKQILEAFSNHPITVDLGLNVQVTIDIGGAIASKDMQGSVKDPIAQAQQALDKATQKGRNRMQMFGEGLNL